MHRASLTTADNKVNPFKLAQIQDYLRNSHLQGWLLYDFRGLNPIARRVAEIPADMLLTRRWAYWVPAEGEPAWLVHRIEAGAFRRRPERLEAYSSWQSLREGLQSLMGSPGPIACEYSPGCEIPYVSYVDAGTAELLRGSGFELRSSADLVQLAVAVWSAEQLASHRRAATICLEAKDAAFAFIAEQLRAGQDVDEFAVQQFIIGHFQMAGLDPDHPPIVAVNANAGNPHYEPTLDLAQPISRGDLILIDLWGRERDDPEAVFADITWMGFAGSQPPARAVQVLDIVARARDVAINLVQNHISRGEPLQGWQVDDAARSVIEKAGFGPNFIHRTGHSVDTSTHGSGVNMDNLEAHDTRHLEPGIGFTIEPGIYLPDFGVRLEINMFVHEDRAEVTTLPLQYEFVTLDVGES